MLNIKNRFDPVTELLLTTQLPPATSPFAPHPPHSPVAISTEEPPLFRPHLLMQVRMMTCFLLALRIISI
jgi:hypothetical protein